MTAMSDAGIAGAKAHNVRFLGHTDQGGRPDGVQIMVSRGYAYIGHMFADGFSVIDVREPRQLRTVAFVAAPPNTRAPHLQVHENLLLVVNAANVWALQQYQAEAQYFAQPLADSFSRRTERPFAAGLRIYDLTDPALPREIAFLEMPGIGLHRIWYIGGRYAYVSAHLEGYSDHILAVIDLATPTAPRLAGTWWLPGMWRAGGESPQWRTGQRWALHHAIVRDGLAFGAWRDGGLTIHDCSDPAAPRLLVHRNWSPPFGGGTHTALPLLDRALLVVADEATTNNCANGIPHSWVFDIREPANPVSLATLPTPAEEDFCVKGGKFGPHNLHENRPGSLVSSQLVFATYYNAGLRVFDLSDAFRPRQTGYFIAPSPERLIDTRPGAVRVTSACDVYVDPNGVMLLSDTNAGLYALQYDPR
jgi:hypothetical protein